jgi:uncharacterized SAM-binding protein YcdF (DUF218 family)
MRHSKPVRHAVTGVVMLVIFWLAGFIVFIRAIEVLGEASITPEMLSTDAIVVLTGGSERVATGLELLNAGKGKKLFISGVHHGLSLDRVVGNQQVSKDLRDCCIILGHAAESTRGNAEETQTWMALEDYHSMRLVTANYHMPRSLLVFRAAMPDIAITPHPVAPDSVKLEDWWQHPGTISLLVTEYNKYLFAALRQRANHVMQSAMPGA